MPRRSASSRHGGGAVELLGQLVAGLGQVEPELLQPARHAHGPRGVTEEALDLADDGRHREGGELDAAAELEAVDRLDQADRADLDDVLHRLAARAEPGGGELDQGEVEFDERVADVRVLVRAFLERLQPLEEGLGQGPRVHRPHLVERRDLRETRKPGKRVWVVALDALDGIQMFRRGMSTSPAGYAMRRAGVTWCPPSFSAYGCRSQYVHCGVRRLQSRPCRLRVSTSPTRFPHATRKCVSAVICPFAGDCSGVGECEEGVVFEGVSQQPRRRERETAWTAGRSAAHSLAGFWSRSGKRASAPS